MAPKQLYFITGNKNKLIESEAILGDTVDLKSRAIELVEIQGTIEEISADKCRRAAEAVCIPHYDSQTSAKILQVRGPVLVEDTCLCFNALKELPGPYMYV
jgi:inosine triphosphate pyrophosphatase